MPDATATNTSVWLVLLPVIVGGIIGLAGGLIGPPFVHHLQTKAEKKKRRSEKFEELVAALFESFRSTRISVGGKNAVRFHVTSTRSNIGWLWLWIPGCLATLGTRN